MSRRCLYAGALANSYALLRSQIISLVNNFKPSSFYLVSCVKASGDHKSGRCIHWVMVHWYFPSIRREEQLVCLVNRRVTSEFRCVAAELNDVYLCDSAIVMHIRPWIFLTAGFYHPYLIEVISIQEHFMLRLMLILRIKMMLAVLMIMVISRRVENHLGSLAMAQMLLFINLVSSFLLFSNTFCLYILTRNPFYVYDMIIYHFFVILLL